MSISAPIYHKEGAEEPVGVIEGFINLASFVNIERADQTDNLQSMIIMDDNNRIIYASDKLTLPALSIFKSVKKAKVTIPAYIYSTFMILKTQLLNLSIVGTS